MGVTNLWQVLDPVKRHQTLSTLRGQTLAVDLSIWVCETQCVKQMQGVVTKPFLRNLFFRVSHLLQLGVHLVFVIEGNAPDLKQQTMAKRQESRFHHKKVVGGQRRTGRRNFNACLRECCEMLDDLGIPYIQSPGEAEATCAALNARGAVDGCLTNDGDAFLYGARTVYRNFTMNTKDPHVECYSMTDVEERLGLTREKLVAMALLLGCDYLPKGVPGVGMERAIKLMKALAISNVLERFEEWRSMPETLCVDSLEVFVRRKAVLVPDFPHREVILEFMQGGRKCPTRISKWSRPSMADLQVFCLSKLEWPVEYTLEKVLPMITLWDMTDIVKGSSPSNRHLVPRQIIKSRIRHGVNCYEVLWIKPDVDSLCSEDLYRTIEEQNLFGRSYPQIVAEFYKEQATKKTKDKGKKSKKKITSSSDEKDIVELSQTLESIDLTGNSDDVVAADDEAIKECCGTVKEGIAGTGGGLLTVNKKQQNTASPMCRLELAMRSIVKQSDKQVVVERNLNFSSSEDEDDEYLPLSQRLQLKIAKPRVEQNNIKLPTVPPMDPQSQAGGGDNDAMVRAISLGVSTARRDHFSSDSDSEDLPRFLSQSGNENFPGKVTKNTEYKDKMMDVIDSGLNCDGSFHVGDEISCGDGKTSPNGKHENYRASKGTPMWQRSFETPKVQMKDKTEFLNIPNVNFTVLTPSIWARGESKVGPRRDVSTSTPEGQSAEYTCLSRFSHNLSNLSPHLSEDLAGSPLLTFDSLPSSTSLSSGKHLHNVSALWESVLSNTNTAHEFGNFEVQTSLLNSFSKVDITNGELSTLTSSFTEQRSTTPTGNVLTPLNKEITDVHETGKVCNIDTQEEDSVIDTQEEDSVIVPNNMSFSDNENENMLPVNFVNSVKKQNESTLQVRSALRTVNGQNANIVIQKCSKDQTKEQCMSSVIPQAPCSPSQNQCLSLPVIPRTTSSREKHVNSLCVDKENQSCDGREECSIKSPMSLIERLQKRLDNHPDSSLIHNIKYGPLSVKPVK